MLYGMKSHADGWAIVDARTGEVAHINDEPQTGLSLPDALEIVDLLCRIDSHKPERLN